MDTIQTFTYQQLSTTAKQYALEQYQGEPDDFNWCYADLKDMLVEDMAERGITVEDVQYSGFWSQGDGASFTGSIDLKEFMDWEAKQNPASNMALSHPHIYTSLIPFNNDDMVYEWLVVLSRTGHHYSHENTVHINLDYNCYGDEDEIPQDEVASLTDGLQELCRGYMIDFYRRLEAQYDYVMSGEHFVESCDCNGWVFDEKGKIQW